MAAWELLYRYAAFYTFNFSAQITRQGSDV